MAESAIAVAAAAARPVRLCFHCGQPGHRAAVCPSRSAPAGHQSSAGDECSSDATTCSTTSSSSTLQSAAGREALQRYLQCRRDLAEQRRRLRRLRLCFDGEDGDGDEQCLADSRAAAAAAHAACGGSSGSGGKGPMHHFDRVVQWMKDAAPTGSEGHDCSTDADTSTTVRARDPISILQAEARAASASSIDGETIHYTNTLTNQRWSDLHKMKWNDLDKGHREAFNQIMDETRRLLADRLGITPEDEAASSWQVELTRAVELGRPADFSARTESCESESDIIHNDEHDGASARQDEHDAGRCIRIYAVEKLHARCRQLHHLVFNNDAVSGRVRSLLLPLPLPLLSSGNNDNAFTNDTGINVISLGGGPGYDHVALCLAAKFLHDVQPQRRMMRSRRITTQIFDLFDRDWEPIMVSLGECCHRGLLNGSRSSSEDDGGNATTTDCRNMSMHHADIRMGLDDAGNSDFSRALESVDIICVQFVLHENASYIFLEDSSSTGDRLQQRIQGAMKDVLERAPLGTIMICTDSSNALFPPLKNTARAYGWAYLGDEEKRARGDKMAFLGPKSYVILERLRSGGQMT